MESFNHIELTEEEVTEAILRAKERKSEILKAAEREARAVENRRQLTSTRWTADQMSSFAIYRAGTLFGKAFTLDHDNRIVFDLLCLYFAEDQNFIRLATEAGINNPSLTKGILLAGNFGTGKTWMLSLFSRNQRQCYGVLNAKSICEVFHADGAIDQFIQPTKNPINDKAAFFQPVSGLCIDDIGTEEVKNHFGNKKNVIGDLIELRYSSGFTGPLLHGTTNLTGTQLKEFYGGRVTSRMREIFNIIELGGQDRRQ